MGKGYLLPLGLLVVVLSIVAGSSSGNELKDFESNAEALSRQVREAAKPKQRKKGKKLANKRVNRKRQMKKSKNGSKKRAKNTNQKKVKRRPGRRRTDEQRPEGSRKIEN